MKIKLKTPTLKAQNLDSSYRMKLVQDILNNQEYRFVGLPQGVHGDNLEVDGEGNLVGEDQNGEIVLIAELDSILVLSSNMLAAIVPPTGAYEISQGILDSIPSELLVPRYGKMKRVESWN